MHWWVCHRLWKCDESWQQRYLVVAIVVGFIVTTIVDLVVSSGSSLLLLLRSWVLIVWRIFSTSRVPAWKTVSSWSLMMSSRSSPSGETMLESSRSKSCDERLLRGMIGG